MKRDYAGSPARRKKRARWLLPSLLVALATLAVIAFCYLFPAKGAIPDLADIRTYFVRTRVAERFVIAEQDAWFASDYTIPPGSLGMRASYGLRFRVMIHLSFALKIDDPGWNLVVRDGKVTVRTPPMYLLPPGVLPDTFELLREDGSVFASDPGKKAEFLALIAAWIGEKAPEIADFKAARENGAISAEAAVRKSFDMFGKKADELEILIP